MKKNTLKIKYVAKTINSKSKQALGMIFRIFNKYDGKSYINASVDVKRTIKEIIDKLINGNFSNLEMQRAWKAKPFSFEAEDLQNYYSKEEMNVLLHNWQTFFGGQNYSLIYNKEQIVFSPFKKDGNVNINVRDLLEENQQYANYSNQLLTMNQQLKEQVDILNQNLIQLNSYNVSSTENSLAKINQLILQRVERSPIQVLQMLTSLLMITSTECNKQFNVNTEKFNVNTEKINTNMEEFNTNIEEINTNMENVDTDENNNIEFINDDDINEIENKNDVKNNYLIIDDDDDDNKDKDTNEIEIEAETKTNNKEIEINETTINRTKPETNKIEISSEMSIESLKDVKEILTSKEKIATNVFSEVIKKAISFLQNILQQIWDDFKFLYAFKSKDELIKNKDQILAKIDDTKQLFNDALDLLAKLNTRTQMMNSRTKRIIKQITNQLNLVNDEFNTFCKQASTCFSQSYNAQELLAINSKQLFNLKFKRAESLSTKNNLTNNDSINTKHANNDLVNENFSQASTSIAAAQAPAIASTAITSTVTSSRSLNKNKFIRTPDGFAFYDGSKSINDWLQESLTWLKNNNARLFAAELEREVNKLMINKVASRTLQVFQAYTSGKTYDDIAKQFNIDDHSIIARNIDSVQNLAPAIYLSFGHSSKTSTGKEKRVLTVLKNKGITDIPASF